MGLHSHLKERIAKFAEGPYSTAWLSFFSFVEAAVFPIPPDILLIAILTTKENKRWLFYSLVTSVSSVFGGILGYFIGYSFFSLFGEQVITFYGLEDKFIAIGNIFQEGAFLSVFVAAFTPIPYKVFTIAAGVFELNFFTFMIASIVGRSARFFLVGLMMHLFGKKIGKAIYAHINAVSIVFAVVIVGIAVLFLL
jgi:membrane protein YqaA with SNARE-associated domain